MTHMKYLGQGKGGERKGRRLEVVFDTEKGWWEGVEEDLMGGSVIRFGETAKVRLTQRL